jgi:multidrug efflux system outer membrane protein
MNGSTSATLLLIGTLAACSFTPTYTSPPSSAPPASAYQEAGDWKVAEPMDAQSRGDWWTAFNDPQLDGLEAKVGAANQDIKAAIARLQQARAETRIQRAGLFPTLSIGSSVARGRASPNSPTFLHGAEPTYRNFDL